MDTQAGEGDLSYHTVLEEEEEARRGSELREPCSLSDSKGASIYYVTSWLELGGLWKETMEKMTK